MSRSPRGSTAQIFDGAFDPVSGVGWRLGRLVADIHPGKYVLDGVGSPFDLEDFAAESGRCTITLDRERHAQLHTSWRRKHGLHTSVVNGVYHVAWEGHALRVVVAQWRAGYETVSVSLVVADDEAIARKFAHEVCAFCNEPRKAV